MKKLRKIKKYAGMWVIKLFPIDIVDMKLKEEDDVDISKLKKEESK